MRYEDLRQLVHEHFRKRLAAFREKIANDGPLEGNNLEAAKHTMDLANLDFSEWLDLLYSGDGKSLVDDFCREHGVKAELTANAQRRLLQEFHKANQAYLSKAIEYNSSYDELDIEANGTAPSIVQEQLQSNDAEPYKDVVQRHLNEGERSGLWREKTLSEKREALSLLGDLTQHKGVGNMTKSDARQVKSALQKLPKNRNKSPLTRHLSLSEMLKLKGAPLTSVRTLNGYMSAFQTFFGWAVEHGYADTNIFQGMRFKNARNSQSDRREALNIDQLNLIFLHLTENPAGLVKKDEHKWVSLIAMFSGARLGEVTQLKVGDVRTVGDVWCFDLTTEDGDGKRLKTSSSKRLVPIHDSLLDCGLLAFVQEQQDAGHARLFSKLSYNAQNGYGRNVGRWFNDSLLVKLKIKKPTLVFHSLRHSMNTQLAQRDVPDHLQKAVLGHAQSGMSYDTYFRDGFLLSQLRPVVNQFSLDTTAKETDSAAQ